MRQCVADGRACGSSRARAMASMLEGGASAGGSTAGEGVSGAVDAEDATVCGLPSPSDGLLDREPTSSAVGIPPPQVAATRWAAGPKTSAIRPHPCLAGGRSVLLTGDKPSRYVMKQPPQRETDPSRTSPIVMRQRPSTERGQAWKPVPTLDGSSPNTAPQTPQPKAQPSSQPTLRESPPTPAPRTSPPPQARPTHRTQSPQPDTPG